MSVDETYEVIRGYFKDKPVRKVQVFGSYARRQHTDSSDIDLILTMEKPIGLMQLARYKFELQDILHREIDIATEPAISNDFRKFIEKDLTTLYDRG